MKVSEKSLELNIGAEILNHLRALPGMRKAYLRGLTQAEEAQEGVDFFAHLDPATTLVAFQFKAPRGRTEGTSYKYTLMKYQHDVLYRLAKANPRSVFYAFPFFLTPGKLSAVSPNLLSETWFLDAGKMDPKTLFGTHESRTITCRAGTAKVNPEFALHRLDALEMSASSAVKVRAFASWYKDFRQQGTTHRSTKHGELKWRNAWITRGLRCAIVPPDK